MEKQSLVSALKNAVERGYDIEEAKLTLINAGYNVSDVEEAVIEFKSTKQKTGISKPKFFLKTPKP